MGMKVVWPREHPGCGSCARLQLQRLNNFLGHAKQRHTLATVQLTLEIGDELQRGILDTFYPPAEPEQLPNYTGLSRSGMDSDFTPAKLPTVLAPMQRNTTAGAYEITYAMLRNLSPDQQATLPGFFNIWCRGTLQHHLDKFKAASMTSSPATTSLLVDQGALPLQRIDVEPPRSRLTNQHNLVAVRAHRWCCRLLQHL